MTKYALFILALAFSFLSSAQDFEWLVSGGGPLSDKATDIAVDHEGNIFITKANMFGKTRYMYTVSSEAWGGVA